MARACSAPSLLRAASITDHRVSGKRSLPWLDLSSFILCVLSLPELAPSAVACGRSLCRTGVADKASLGLASAGFFLTLAQSFRRVFHRSDHPRLSRGRESRRSVHDLYRASGSSFWPAISRFARGGRKLCRIPISIFYTSCIAALKPTGFSYNTHYKQL